MCFTVQLSRFLSVFDSFDILSYHFVFVKNFFQKVFLQCVEKPFSTACNFLLFVVIFATAILDYHIFSDLSITFFIFFKILFRNKFLFFWNFITSYFLFAFTATLIYYHISRYLSTTFFILFTTVKSNK